MSRFSKCCWSTCWDSVFLSENVVNVVNVFEIACAHNANIANYTPCVLLRWTLSQWRVLFGLCIPRAAFICNLIFSARENEALTKHLVPVRLCSVPIMDTVLDPRELKDLNRHKRGVYGIPRSAFPTKEAFAQRTFCCFLQFCAQRSFRNAVCFHTQGAHTVFSSIHCF